MKDAKVSTVMVQPVVSAKTKTPAENIASVLLYSHYTGMPVVDDVGRVVGIVTELDLLDALMEGKNLSKVSAEQIMTKEPVTADVDTPVSEVIATMKKKNIIRLPITREGKLAGIVARCDILKSQMDPTTVFV